MGFFLQELCVRALNFPLSGESGKVASVCSSGP